MRDMMRSAARPRRRSCSGDTTSMTSDCTWATCPGAAGARVWKPWSVRMALVNRPSAGSGSRRTRPRSSRRLTRCDSRDSDALARSASKLIRRVRSGLCDNLAMTWYLTIPRLESRRSCWSIDQGSQLINRTTESQESSSAAVSQFTGAGFSVPGWAPSDISQRYRSLDDSSGNCAPARCLFAPEHCPSCSRSDLERRNGMDDGLGFGELGDGERAAPPADAPLLVAALGEAGVDRRRRIGPDGAVVDLAGIPGPVHSHAVHCF